jgi:flagellar hook capping protein FlgD
VSATRGESRPVHVRMPVVCSLLACALLAWGAAPACAQAVAYTLSPGAEFRTGCFTVPCVCAPVQNAMTGTFALVRQPADAQFAHFDVVVVNWVVQFPQGDVPITGSGTYRVGGAGIVQQQLSLDLKVGSGVVKHFDSGLVAGGGDFPRLDVEISLHGKTPCVDTVLLVRAGPGGTTGVGSSAVSLGSLARNPFRALTRLEFSLHDAGRVRVSVHDAAGRRLRTLADGVWLGAGPHALDWDGRRDDGRACAPGRYFVRVQAGGRIERTTVVKLR